MFHFVELCLTSLELLKLGKTLHRVAFMRGEFISGYRTDCIPFNSAYIELRLRVCLGSILKPDRNEDKGMDLLKVEKL